MHTRFAMVIPGMSGDKGDLLARVTEQIVEDWEQCMSAFRLGAELQRINHVAPEREFRVSERMNRVLDLCDHYNRATGGLFDPAVNRNKSKWTDVVRNPERGSIRFARPGVELDLGGIGKGIAMEAVHAYLKLEGVKDAFLSFGESSIAGIGKHPHGDGWLVGTGEGMLLSDEFAAVSGLQELQSHEGPESRAHIYHPLKGELVSSRRRVMVKCDSPVEAEVLSTCAYMADEAEFSFLKSQFPDAEWRVD